MAISAERTQLLIFTARPRTSIAMLAILSALNAYHFGVVPAVGTLQPSAVGGVLVPGCTDLDRRPGEATAACFDPQFASPYDGALRYTAEPPNAERVVTSKTVQGGNNVPGGKNVSRSGQKRMRKKVNGPV